MYHTSIMGGSFFFLERGGGSFSRGAVFRGADVGALFRGGGQFS